MNDDVAALAIGSVSGLAPLLVAVLKDRADLCFSSMYVCMAAGLVHGASAAMTVSVLCAVAVASARRGGES